MLGFIGKTVAAEVRRDAPDAALASVSMKLSQVVWFDERPWSNTTVWALVAGPAVK